VTHESPYGTIKSAWRTEGRNVVYTAIVPPNSTATLELPGKPAQELTAGEYTYRVPVQ
jgi:alpha-L-rhamnosidase